MAEPQRGDTSLAGNGDEWLAQELRRCGTSIFIRVAVRSSIYFIGSEAAGCAGEATQRESECGSAVEPEPVAAR